MSTLATRKRNHIASIKDEGGLWITKEKEVMEYFRKGFISLYSTFHWKAPRCPIHETQWQVQLSDKAKSSLEAMVTLEEVKDALWSMKPYKSPGPDGLHAGFFQSFWFLVGDSVREVVFKAFIERKIPEYINKTLIVLSPKVQSSRSSPKLLLLGLDCIWRASFFPTKLLSFRVEEEQIMLS